MKKVKRYDPVAETAYAHVEMQTTAKGSYVKFDDVIETLQYVENLEAHIRRIEVAVLNADDEELLDD